MPPAVIPASSIKRDVANASNQHCTCFGVLGDGRGFLSQNESYLEFCAKLIANADPDVVFIEEQTLFLYGPERKQRHWFDIKVTKRDGTVQAITCKPDAKVGRRQKNQLKGENFLTHMQEVAWWVRELGYADEVKLITDNDIDPILLHNAQIIAAVREEDPEAMLLARRAVRDMIGARTVRDLTCAIGEEERGYRALLRMIRLGELIPQAGKRITPSILVSRKVAVQ